MRSRSRARATGTLTGTMIALSPSTSEAYTVPPPMNAVELEFRHVSRRYGDTVAVDDLSLTVPAGKICVLVGPSGCGKTTSLKMVNRLIEPTSGEILIGGRDVMTQNPIELRRGIGYVIQQGGL